MKERRFVLAPWTLLVLLGSGCPSFLPDRPVDASVVVDIPSRDAPDAVVDAPPECDPGRPCTSGLRCADARCVPCDGDLDTFFDPDPSCDAVALATARDCDDGNAAVFPGAPPICGDGVVNACDGTGVAVPTELSDLGDEIGLLPRVSLAESAGALSLGGIAADGNHVVASWVDDSTGAVHLTRRRASDLFEEDRVFYDLSPGDGAYSALRENAAGPGIWFGLFAYGPPSTVRLGILDATMPLPADTTAMRTIDPTSTSASCGAAPDNPVQVFYGGTIDVTGAGDFAFVDRRTRFVRWSPGATTPTCVTGTSYADLVGSRTSLFTLLDEATARYWTGMGPADIPGARAAIAETVQSAQSVDYIRPEGDLNDVEHHLWARVVGREIDLVGMDCDRTCIRGSSRVTIAPDLDTATAVSWPSVRRQSDAAFLLTTIEETTAGTTAELPIADEVRVRWVRDVEMGVGDVVSQVGGPAAYIPLRRIDRPGEVTDRRATGLYTTVVRTSESTTVFAVLLSALRVDPPAAASEARVELGALRFCVAR